MNNYISCVGVAYFLPDGRSLLSSVNVTFNAERTALIGPNGIGKTTLLELLAGIRTPASGFVARSGRTSILRQAEAFDRGTTVADALGVSEAILALQRIERGAGGPSDFDSVEGCWDLQDRIEVALKTLGINHLQIETPLANLSGGELMRVRIAGPLLESPDFLLLDEPTNHLDLTARLFIYEMARSWRKGLVVVTHDRRLLAEVDCIAELDSTGLKVYGGNYEFYRDQKAIQEAAARAAFDSAKQRLKKAEAMAAAAEERQQRRQAAGRYRKIRTGIPKMMAGGLRRRSEVTAGKLAHRHESKVEDAKAVVAESRGRVPVDQLIRVDLHASAVPAGRRIVELEGVNYRFPGSASELWQHPLDLLVTGPRRIWLKGPNGSGKSTLIDLICGKKTPSTGSIRVGSEKIGLLDQRLSVLDDRLTLVENIRLRAPRRPISEIRTLLGRFLFVQDAALKPVATLSGGERVRAGLACLLAADQSPDLLILDEPANNLDLQSMQAVASVVADFSGALIVVTHDVDFLSDVKADSAYDLESLTWVQE